MYVLYVYKINMYDDAFEEGRTNEKNKEMKTNQLLIVIW